MALAEALRGKRICIDTAPLIMSASKLLIVSPHYALDHCYVHGGIDTTLLLAQAMFAGRLSRPGVFCTEMFL